MIFKNFGTFIYSIVFFWNVVRCSDFDVGNAIDLYKNYGLLAKILPVAAKNYDEFLEFEFYQNIFDKDSVINNFTYRYEQNDDKWKINVCLNYMELVRQFFDGYAIEMVEDVAKSFASSWKIKDIEETFGISEYYLSNDFIFVLIRHKTIISHNLLERLPTNQTDISKKFRLLIDTINTADSKTVNNVVAEFGSHFVKSFSLGDVVYQVLVYPKGATTCLNYKSDAILVTCALYSIVRAGEIKSLSNSIIKQPISTKKKMNNLLIMKLRNDLTLFKNHRPKNLAIVEFNLTSIHSVIQNQTTSLCVKEIIDNQMKLIELSE